MPVTARSQSVHQTVEGTTPGWVHHYEHINRGVRNFQLATPNTRRCAQTPLNPEPIGGREAIDLFLPQKNVFQDQVRPNFQVNRQPLDGEYFQSTLRSFIKDTMSLPSSNRGELDGLAPDSTRANPNGQQVVPRSGTMHFGTRRAVYRIRNQRRTTLFRLGNAQVRNTTYSELGHVKPARNGDVREAILRDPLPESDRVPNNGPYVPQKEVRSDRPTSKEAAINRVGTANAWRGNSAEAIRPDAENVESSIRRRKLQAGTLIGPQHAHQQGAGILTVLDKRLHPRLCAKKKNKKKVPSVDPSGLSGSSKCVLPSEDSNPYNPPEDKRNVKFFGSREEFSSNPTAIAYTQANGREVAVENCNYDSDEESDNEVIQIRHPEERPSLAMATVVGKNKFSDPAPEAGARHVRDNAPRLATPILNLPRRFAYTTTKNRGTENDVRNRQSMGQASQRNSGNVITLTIPKRLAQQTTKNRSNENDVAHRQSLGFASQYLSGQDLPSTNRQSTEINRNHGYYNVPQRPGMKTQAASVFTDHTPTLTNRTEYADAPSHANVPTPNRASLGTQAGTYTIASSQRTHAVDFLDADSRQNMPERQRGSIGMTNIHASNADFRPNIKGYMRWLQARVPNGVNPLGTTADMFGERRVHFSEDATRVISHDGEEQLAGRPQHYGQVGVGRRTNGYSCGDARVEQPTYYNRMDPGTDLLTPLYNNPYKVWAAMG